MLTPDEIEARTTAIYCREVPQQWREWAIERQAIVYAKGLYLFSVAIGHKSPWQRTAQALGRHLGEYRRRKREEAMRAEN